MWEKWSEEGIRESQGEFTVDWRRMRQAYADLGLKEPTLPYCKFFQASVALGLTWVDCRWEAKGSSMLWSEPGFQREELEGVARALVSGAACAELSAAGQHLLWGLRFCQATVREARVSSPPWSLVVDQAGARVTRGGEAAGVHLVLDRPLSLWDRAGWDPRKPFLERVCSPFLEVRTGGKPLEERRDFEWEQPAYRDWAVRLATAFLLPAKGRRPLGVPIGRRSEHSYFFQGEELVEALSSEAMRGQRLGVEAVVHLVGHRDLSAVEHAGDGVWEDHLVAVGDGIALKMPVPWLGKVGLTMVACADGLPTDATTLTLVDGPELKAWMDQCTATAWSFLDFLDRATPAYRAQWWETWIVPKKLPLGKYLPVALYLAEKIRRGD